MDKNILITMLLVLFTTANYAQSKRTENTIVEDEFLSEKSNADQQCFDNSMKQWFHSFFLLQDEGYDMKQADYIAYQEVKDTYKDCAEVTSRKRVIDKRLKSRL